MYSDGPTVRSGDRTTVPFSSRVLFSIHFNLVNPRPCWPGVERAHRRASIRGVATPASLFGSSVCVSLRTYRRIPSPPPFFVVCIERSYKYAWEILVILDQHHFTRAVFVYRWQSKITRVYCIGRISFNFLLRQALLAIL